ncbi:AAA family ATPase [Neomoorella thermoacetica]|uniref:Septum site-determining protein MinD n=3 Tax=Neomoorella thermoacetica TaxID=1525 RepID=A0A1D7XAJ4_NEOTH|nr:AAA family ATPase [Moorella thermoacetica]AKX93977.1 septum site-determining protein MinD [Moorella thermoacetica]AKX96617.1 septum site-determining protein MinD [Moorella thermoacetica]AOQ23928.1 Septum site-determining protein MinD [Moorella thermoacetica]OIQ12880.1 septum site-determining protein MinD [Moorella thermoacetica]OIQ56346.1 septum site-determining protein MinD [Moorella thermoacetica]
MKLAISGKGGVGKTTIAAGLIKYFAGQGYQVYAVDADPDTSLGMVLGLPEERLGTLKPIVDMRQIIAERTGGEGAFFALNPEVDSLLEDFTIKNDNILFLKMGAIKPGGSTCYCRENTVLNAMINSLLLKRREMVVLDMGAGIEHLTRGTARGVDTMLIVTEPTLVSIQTARVIQKLASELGIEQIKFIGNKLRHHRDEEFILNHLPSGEVIGLIPFQPAILDQAAGITSTQSFIATGITELASRLIEN